MKKVFKVAHIKFLERQIALGNISYAKMAEILNEIAYNHYVLNGKLKTKHKKDEKI